MVKHATLFLRSEIPFCRSLWVSTECREAEEQLKLLLPEDSRRGFLSDSIEAMPKLLELLSDHEFSPLVEQRFCRGINRGYSLLQHKVKSLSWSTYNPSQPHQVIFPAKVPSGRWPWIPIRLSLPYSRAWTLKQNYGMSFTENKIKFKWKKNQVQHPKLCLLSLRL